MFEFRDVLYKDILDLPDLEIQAGIVTTLVGPSGSGKSTILRLLNKMTSPTSGKIFFEGKDLAEIPSVEHRRSVAMLTQSPAMFSGTVGDNLLAGFRFQQRPLPEETELQETLYNVHLNKSLASSAMELSGGEKQRLALGRVLLMDATVFLFDEPSSALDEDTERFVIERLTGQAKEKGKTIVLVTHSKAVAETYSDEIVEIAGGKVKGRK
ncbi:MAG: ABC transporter ATP-binding protein [Firmicutes bacterium HGW-Firmicutes-11]|jgi:putative ABC transport system ATP-binding protein|nr:MAG: ABC transporter ATP-binding protein [Firmicutes bacterium HGW-Firmicutes-11]